MLYELAYPALLVGAKSRQTARRARARLGLAPAEIARLTLRPESCYRVACWWLRRTDVAILMRLAPRRAARLAVERFETTRRMAPRGAPEGGELTWLRWRGIDVALRLHGPEDGPPVLALHGWNGRGAMLRGLAEALAARGYRVLLPDLPGHGASGGERYAFYDVARACAELFGPKGRFEAVIGHSAGGLIAAMALGRGLDARAFVPIGAPASLSELLRSYVEITQMPPASLAHIERLYARLHGTAPAEMGPPLVARLPVRTLVVHERSDWQVGEANARALHGAARDGTLLLTRGYTHLSVLNAPEVQERIAAFLAGGARRRRGGAAQCLTSPASAPPFPSGGRPWPRPRASWPWASATAGCTSASSASPPSRATTRSRWPT